MGHEKDCDCGDFESSDAGVSQGWLHWLDRRNEIRAAWTVLAIQGSLVSQDGLARNLHELQESSKVGDSASGNKGASGIIRTKDELWKFVADKNALSNKALGRLPAKALEKFISGVQFEDYMKDGQRYQHVGVFYYGDLQIEYGFSFSELFEVFALFGISAEFAVRAYDKFGWDVDRQRCQPRLHYNCPWSSNC